MIILTYQQSRAELLQERGGIVRSLQFPNKMGIQEYLYRHHFFESSDWADLPGGLPLCFPVCARLKRDGQLGRYAYEGRYYQLPIHGFAWQASWEVVHQTAHTVRLALSANAHTRACYQFEFYVSLEYQLGDRELRCIQRYENRGDYPMPYCAGFHPYFLTPHKSATQITYVPTKRFVYNADLTDIVGETALFDLPTQLDNPVLNEQLTWVGADTCVQLHYPTGEVLTMTALGHQEPFFPYVQLYTMSDRPFFCVEPWMGMPNAMNTVSGMRWLAPHAVETGELVLALHH